jgi:hypothetical protein
MECNEQQFEFLHRALGEGEVFHASVGLHPVHSMSFLPAVDFERLGDF